LNALIDSINWSDFSRKSAHAQNLYLQEYLHGDKMAATTKSVRGHTEIPPVTFRNTSLAP
jgi:hypothetical protein